MTAPHLRSLGLFARTTADGIDVATRATRRTLSKPEATALIKAWDPERADELLDLFAQTHRPPTPG